MAKYLRQILQIQKSNATKLMSKKKSYQNQRTISGIYILCFLWISTGIPLPLFMTEMRPLSKSRSTYEEISNRLIERVRLVRNRNVSLLSTLMVSIPDASRTKLSEALTRISSNILNSAGTYFTSSVNKTIKNMKIKD